MYNYNSSKMYTSMDIVLKRKILTYYFFNAFTSNKKYQIQFQVVVKSFLTLTEKNLLQLKMPFS